MAGSRYWLNRCKVTLSKWSRFHSPQSSPSSDTLYFLITAGPTPTFPSRRRRYGGYYGGVSTSTTTVSTWQIGTLVIDAWDGESKDLIWRGTAEETISPNPQKMEKKINKAVAKLFKAIVILVQIFVRYGVLVLFIIEVFEFWKAIDARRLLFLP